MVTETIPQNKKELKKFIIETIHEVSERFVPTISQDEQKELESLYGKDLYNDDYSKDSCERL